MRIDCPSCARTYIISRAVLGPVGRHLVCQFCDTRWLVQTGDAIKDEDERDLIAAVEEAFGPDEGCQTGDDVASDAARAAEAAAPGETVFQPGFENTREGHEPQAKGAFASALDADEFPPGPAFAEEVSIDREADRWPAAESADARFINVHTLRDPLPATRPKPARPHLERAKRQHGALRPVAALATCFILSMALIGKRDAIARALPGTRMIYAAMGLRVHPSHLEFGNVTTARLDGGTTIAVSGTIHNAARQRVDVPRLGFEIRDAAGLVVASWSENPPKHSLGAEETLAFSTKTPVPEGSKDVAVHFTSEAPVKSLRDIVGRAPAK